MNWSNILPILFLLLIANGAPIIVREILANRLARPLDGGIVLGDGRRLFGPTKTVRGIIAAVVATGLIAPAVGISFVAGVLLAAGSMIGDLMSSFIKRRLGIASSESVLGLDQGLEALVPALLLHRRFSLTLLDVLVIGVVFFVLSILISRLLYWLRIRKHPF